MTFVQEELLYMGRMENTPMGVSNCEFPTKLGKSLLNLPNYGPIERVAVVTKNSQSFDPMIPHEECHALHVFPQQVTIGYTVRIHPSFLPLEDKKVKRISHFGTLEIVTLAGSDTGVAEIKPIIERLAQEECPYLHMQRL